MGRKPCCSKVENKKGPWTSQEDKILVDYVKIHGEGKWRNLAQKAGLKRCGKSCRLRWLNYLRPGIKLGNISEDEEDLIIKLHRLLGNRWTLIAGRLPGRSGNEIKNYWNTTLSKKLLAQKNKHNRLEANLEEEKADDQDKSQPVATVTTTTTTTGMQPIAPSPATESPKADSNPPDEQQNIDQDQLRNGETSFWEYIFGLSSSLLENDDPMRFWMDPDISQHFTDALDKHAHIQEHISEAEVALSDYDFSFDIFSPEP